MSGARAVEDTGGEREAGADAWLTFAVLQVADSHLQDVGLLQLGVGLVPRELLLQQQLQLLYAAVDAVPTHLLHHRLPQLREERRQVGGGGQRPRGNRTPRAGRVPLTLFFSLGLSISTATVLGAMPGAQEAIGERCGAERNGQSQASRAGAARTPARQPYIGAGGGPAPGARAPRPFPHSAANDGAGRTKAPAH